MWNGQYKSMWRIIGLSIIPGLILIVQNGIFLSSSIQILKIKYVMKGNVHYSLEVGKIIHALQLERGVTALYINSGHDTSLLDRLMRTYQSTDDALHSLSRWSRTFDNNSTHSFSSKSVFTHQLLSVRKSRQNLTFEEVLDVYTGYNNEFIRWMVNAVKEDRKNDYWADMVAYHMLINGKECTGIERAIGTYFFINGHLNTNMLLRYKGRHDLGSTYLDHVKGYSYVGGSFLMKHVDPQLDIIINKLRDAILENTTAFHSIHQAVDWVDNMTVYIDQLHLAKVDMADYITERIEEEISEYKLDVIVDVIILVVTVVVVSVVSFLIFNISKKIETVKGMLQEKTEHLEKEQCRTESLLSQLVPSKIAKRMRNNDANPEFFESVTVMFAEICNLEMNLSKQMPSDVLTMVNDVFDVYEKKIEKYNVSKLGNSGNTIMLAAGLSHVQGPGHKHASEIARLALDLLNSVLQLKNPCSPGNNKVELRIGINTGPVVAGVISTRLPRYCVFGETVKIAKQMADTCLPLHIQLAAATYSELSLHKYLIMKERDDLSLQNRATHQKTYYLCCNTNETVIQLELDVANAVDV